LKQIELQLRREFSEPPSTVLRGFAIMRYSMSATSQAVGLHRQTIKKLADRYGIKFPNYRDMNDMCKAHRGLGKKTLAKRRDVI